MTIGRRKVISFDTQRIASARQARRTEDPARKDSKSAARQSRRLRPLRPVAIAVVAIFSCDLTFAAERAGQQACEREFSLAAARYDVPLGLLYAVGLTESGAKGSLHPLAVNLGGAAHYPGGIAEAVKLVDRARGSGVSLIDVGCMQINTHFHRDKFVSLEDMFDPSRNVRYGAAYLKALRDTTGSWTHAVARYHAGDDNRTAQRRYICKVIRNMIASGFGGWTPDVRRECRK